MTTTTYSPASKADVLNRSHIAAAEALRVLDEIREYRDKIDYELMPDAEDSRDMGRIRELLSQRKQLENQAQELSRVLMMAGADRSMAIA